ncbi:MAG: phage antirepressor KilAC domain-containing protein [Bacteroidales bacterium]|nr:phage antirepressor KilAC domain-containing protein [Candidatus Scybalousia scybalohippi]
MHSSQQFSEFHEQELNLFSENEEKSTNVENISTKSVSVVKQQEVLGKTFRIYGDFENPLFLAKDVAEWIEHSNVTAMLNSVDEDEKVKISPKDCLGLKNNETYNFLTENGLYEVLMLSRKPIAKEFKKEVKKILHELRTKGSFRVPRTMKEALQIALEQQEKIEAQQKLLDEQKPKVELHDKAINADGTFSMDQVASLLKLGYGNITLFKKLRELGILCHDNTPKQEQENAGRFKVVTKTIVKGDKTENTPVTRVTYKGLEYIAKKLGIIFDSSSLEVIK